METNKIVQKGLVHTILYVILSIPVSLLAFSGIAHAQDITFGGPAPDVFLSQQNLVFTASTSQSGTVNSFTPILDTSSSTGSLAKPFIISYQVSNMADWPNHAVSAAINSQLFNETLVEQQLYLGLWEGTPFSSTTTLIKSWNISGKPIGQVSVSLPEAGNYFLAAYLPDGFYVDPQTMCPNDPDWQEDCAPPYTLEQVEGFFATPLDAPDYYDYKPDAYGGLRFSITGTAAPVFKSSNVLFLPGIEGSRLYMRNAKGAEQTLWEPQFLSGLNNLTMNADGSTSQQQVYTRDLVDYVYGQKALGDVYGPFESFLNGLVNAGSITKWQAYPYDWRQDVESVVQNGTLVGQPTGSFSRSYLENVVQALASSSPSGKVSIIAHSNGGLLAKALTRYLAKKGEANLVDRVIFVGSPQYGTPLTVGSLLNGDGQTDATGGLVMYGGNVRQVAATLPGMYGLLPSAQYFAHDADHPVLFPGDPATDLFAKNYGPSISSLSQLSSFLTDSFGLHAKFPASDERTPQVLSNALLSEEASTHTELDAWEAPQGISTYAISGWGNLTPYQYSYTAAPSKQLSCFRSGTLGISCAYGVQVTHVVKNTESGDNTVVSTSAVANDMQQEYFNAKSFAVDKKGKIGHGNLTSAQPIQSYLQNVLTNGNTSQTPYLSSTSPTGGLNPLTVVSVHSPVNLIATDADGNQTGIFPVDGKPGIFIEKENIAGSSLQILDDEKYLYLPSTASYSVSLQGYDNGLTTIDFGTVDAQGVIHAAEEFSSVPTTASTSAQFTLSAPASASSSSSPFPSTIQVDVFGTGSTSSVTAGASTTPQKSLSSLFSLLEHIALTHHLNKNAVEAEFSRLQKMPAPAAGKEIDAVEKQVEGLMQKEPGSSEELLIIELLEEVRQDLTQK